MSEPQSGTPLSRAIDSLSTAGTGGADALRSLLVIAARMKDPQLMQWVRHELDGYPSGVDLPAYRVLGNLEITLRWFGYGGAERPAQVIDLELPQNLKLGDLHLRNPLAELEALAAADGKKDPVSPIPMFWIAAYRKAWDERKVPGWEGMVVNHAERRLPRTLLTGILDQVKTSALQLALDLEQVSPDVGSPGGPTAESEPKLGHETRVFIAHIYGSDATITIGDEATVATGTSTAVRLDAGTISLLVSQAASYLDEESVGELKAALAEDGNLPGEKTQGFLSRVQSGGVSLAAGISSSAAYAGLVALFGHFFPGM